ncbi:hypothetical protein [Actinomadura kijaniata]|uniref:hypothetical protein n=1 Tax=Actinomadura kijaniata TaxID=46161 RepID=UPI000A4B003C|nr:hypothetical protein [Actinomadura kijaniata]
MDLHLIPHSPFRSLFGQFETRAGPGGRGEGSLSHLAAIMLIGAGTYRITGGKAHEKPGGQNPRTPITAPSGQPTSVPPGQETTGNAITAKR